MRTMTGTELYLRLLSHVKPYWRVFALGVLGMAVVAATEPMLPALLPTSQTIPWAGSVLAW